MMRGGSTLGRIDRFPMKDVVVMSPVVVSFVSLKYFETDHVLIMKVYSCARGFDSSYINVKIRVILM